ncbi:hypothetical protein DFJ73DRAFT_827433 [Zopfochytrium polystomum]|nr:hypothetical protein DFJ73DRAFT_827433 [Zopfochytrium polystomum]
MVETQETPLAEQPSDMSAEKRQLSQSREELVPSAKRVKMTQDLETSTVSHPEDGPLFDHDLRTGFISLSPRKPARKLPFQVEGISDELSLISSANLDKITAPKPRTPPVVLETDGEDDDDFDLMVDPSFHMSVAPKEAIEVESLKVATRHSTRMRKQTTPFTIAVGGKRGSYAESDESSLVAGLAQKNKILQSLLDDKRKHDKISKSASALSLHLEMESKAEHEETLDSLQSKVEGLIRSAADGEDAETVASLVKEDLSRLTVSVLVLVGEPKPFPPVELTFEASESDLVGRPLVTAAESLGPDVARSLSSPALLLSVQSGWNMPAEILDWLYKTALIGSCQTVSPMPLELFEEALQTYGVDRQLLQSESAHITDFSHLRDLSSSPTPQGLAAKFPVNNFRAVLRVFVSSLQARKDSYPLTTPARLISLLVKLSLDDQTPYTILHTSLQRLSHLVEPFPHSSSPDGPSPPPAEWISICKSLTAFAGADPRAQDLIVLSPGSPLKRRDPWFFEASRRLAAWWIRRAGPGGGFGTEVSQSPLESGTLSLEQWAEQFSWAKELTHIASIVSQYRTPPATTNHELLACRVRLLAAAVSNIETVRQFPLQSTVLMQELGRLHGSISDARLTNLDRTLVRDLSPRSKWQNSEPSIFALS